MSPAGAERSSATPTLDDDRQARLAGFEAYFKAHIEPQIRLPSGLGKPSPRANQLAAGAAGSLALGAVTWSLQAPTLMVAAPVLLGAALLLGAVQLRMGAQGMGLREARAHVVAKVAAFLGFEYAAELSPEALQRLLGDAGALAPGSIMQRTDHLRGATPGMRFESVQLTATGRPLAVDGQWLGLPLAQLSERYSADGLLVRFDPYAAPRADRPALAAPCTVSSDHRLAFRDHAQARTPTLDIPRSEDAQFNRVFRTHPAWRDDLADLLDEPLRAALLALHSDLGPVTLHLRAEGAHLSVWGVSDFYEVSALGGGLRAQCERIAAAQLAIERLAAALSTTPAGPSAAHVQSQPS